MKLTILLITVVCLHVTAATYAQKVTLNEKDATLDKVFNDIKKQSGYIFFYNNNVLSGTGKVNVNIKDATLQEALDQVLKDQPLNYTIVDNTVVVKKKEKSFLDNLKDKIKAELAQVTIAGKVTNELGEPMAGATVKQKGTNNETVTDAKGIYSITVPDDNTVIVFSYIGYETQEIAAKLISPGSAIALKAAPQNLREVVINKGYYDEKKELSTGDVGVVTAKEIEEQPVTNVLAALEGRVPGLLITQNTGLPGGSFTVQIRGQNSIANGNQPFFVIDGVPYNSQLPGNPLHPFLDGGSPLSYINPYDIESVTILKDAQATAIYGNQAANGAILITTKKGKVGAMKVDLNVNSGFTDPARTLQVLNTQQYLQMRNEAFKNDGVSPGPSDYDVNGVWDTTRYTNWSKVMANKAAQYSTANLSLSGGNTTTQYLIGAGYNNQTTGFPTLLLGNGGDRSGSLHFNITTSSPNNKLTVSLSGSYSADKNAIQSADFTTTALTLAPDAPPIFNPDGSLNWQPLVKGQTGTFQNPYAYLNEQIISNTANLVSSAVINYSFFKGFSLKANLGYTTTNSNEVFTIPTTIYDPAQNRTGASRFQSMDSHTWLIEPQANYQVLLGKGTLEALIGASFHDSYNGSMLESARGFISDALLQDIQAAGSVTATGNSANYRYEGVYARLGYDWMKKYLIDLTARRDGTSRFGPGKQFGDFGAAGLGWIFSKEDFIKKNLGFLSFGKLRASYGITGNDQVPDFQYVDLYSPTTGYSYSGSPGLYPTNLFNQNLAWETTKKLEGGIELGFLNDRINLEASYFRNRSDNQLVSTPVSTVTGFTTIQSNLPALVQNTGVEITLNTKNIQTKGFNWSSSFNITADRNKLLSFPNLASSPYASTLIIGQPITILQLYSYGGVNPQTGLYQFIAANGSLTSTPNGLTDITARVNLTPKFYGGFGNTFSYKNFSIDAFFQFVNQTGRKYWASFYLLPGDMQNIPTNIFMNSWRKPGDQATYEQFTQNGGSAAGYALGYAQSSTFAYGDASYIRLKNVAISWKVPDDLARRIGLGHCRIFIQGQNLLTITGYDGLDPESQSYGTGPRRVYTAGIQAGW